MAPSRRALIVLALALLILPAGCTLVGPARAEGSLILGTAPSGDPTLLQNENITFSVELAKVENLTVVWTLDGVRQDSGGGRLNYTPGRQDVGVHNLTVQVFSPTAREQHSWTVTVVELHAPVEILGWDPAGDIRMPSGSSRSFRVLLSNPGGVPVVFQWFLDGCIVPGQNTSEFRFSTGTDLSGTARITSLVSEGGRSQGFQWNVTIERELVPLPPGPVSLPEGGSQLFRLLGSEGGLNWTLDGVAVGENGANYTFRPGYFSAGAHLLAVLGNGSMLFEWNVSVTNVNLPPVLPQGRIVAVFSGERFTVKVNASDPDGRLVSYAWDLDSDGIQELNSTASPNLSYKFDGPGERRATLTVTDNEGASASAVFLFKVRERPAGPGIWTLVAVLGAVALLLAAVAAVLARRISLLRNRKARDEFFRQRERKRASSLEDLSPPGKEEPVIGGEADLSGDAAPPPVAEAEEEPELLQVKPFLHDKRAELEVSPEHRETDIPLSKKLTPAGPPPVKAPERADGGADVSGALQDKGAESETGAEETELHRHRSLRKKK